MARFLVRLILVAALFVSIGAIWAAFWFLGPSDASTWATVAAALAVITSVISSWTSQRALELQQDAQKPYPYPSIDVESRYGLIQLRVTNYGGGVARDIFLRWKRPLMDSRGELVRFTKQEDVPEIPILLPNESISKFIDGSLLLFQKYTDMNYTGTVEFKDASKRKHRIPFFLSIEKYRSTLTFATEEPKTHHELQKIPQELQKLRGEVSAVRAILQNRFPRNIHDEDELEQSDESTPANEISIAFEGNYPEKQQEGTSVEAERTEGDNSSTSDIHDK